MKKGDVLLVHGASGGVGLAAVQLGKQAVKNQTGPQTIAYTATKPSSLVSILFLSDGKNVFFYVLGEKHATKSAIKESVDPQIPFLFLLGRGNLRQDFTRFELLASERPVEAGNVVLKLVPKRAPEEFKQLLVELSPASFEVRRLVIFERSGARMDFLLSNVQENHVAPDAQFQFTPPAGVTIKPAR